MSELQGQTALITGAARGIGAAIAWRLAREGARICVSDLDGDAAGQTADALVDAGHAAIATQLDVADGPACEAAAKLTADELGGLTILVNNAGLTRSGFVHKMTDEHWDICQDVMLRGPFHMIRACAPWFRARDGESRRVVNISSIAGVYGQTGGANYAAAKAGVIGLTKAMSAEWASYGVTVNAVAPGLIDTQLMNESLPSAMREQVVARIPIGRLGRPEDIAEAVGFLCSPNAGYVTGQLIEVHGGLTDLTPPGAAVTGVPGQ